MSKYESAEYQRAVGDMVRREVIYCVSVLVSDLMRNESEYYDDLLSICTQDDWTEPAYHHARHEMSREELVEYLENEQGMACYDEESHHELAECVSCDDDTAREFCDRFNLDPYQNEAYEHWIVSEWLADKLEAKGEMIGRDIHGLTIWGRTCTGQAIKLDSVICGIYDELHAKAA